MACQPVLSPMASKPVSQVQWSHWGTFFVVLRDNFTISTWLLLGALIQGVLASLPYRNITLVAPVALLLLYQVARTIVQCLGLVHNPRMNGVIPGRTAILFPDDDSGVYNEPADKRICAIVLAVRSNHPLGMFAKGYKEVADYFEDMCSELDDDATGRGYLGASSWISAADRGFASEKMSLLYFESAEKVHEYAHGPLHTKAMQWWVHASKELPHIGLMHEILEAPKGAWEGIYMNYHPTGLGATAKQVTRDGKKTWMTPLVRAKGPLLWSKGRMGRTPQSQDWPEFHEVVVQEEGINSPKE